MLDDSRDVSVVLSALYLWEEQIVEPGGLGGWLEVCGEI